MSRHREHWGSTFGFIMASAGSAIGLGNVWKFPYITGMNGGGAFVLIYLLCVLAVGLPVMLAELAIGRASQSDTIGAFSYFARKESIVPKVFSGYGLGLATFLICTGSIGLGVVLAILSLLIWRFGWKIAGVSSVLVALVILSYYAMIGGWFFIYFWKAITGQLRFTAVEDAEKMFVNVASNGNLTAVFTILFLLICAVVCWYGVRKGLETASKVMMPLLFVLIVILVARGLTLEGSFKGVEFFLAPNFDKLTTHGVLEAMGHSFYTLSLGMGIVVTYGSYLPKNRNLLSSALWVACLDTCMAMLAGLAIFPAVFATGMQPGAGPGLIFNILPVTFQTIPGNLSPLWNGMFFFLMLIAALTSGMSLLEVGISTCMTQWKMSRRKAVILLTIGLSLLSLLSSYSNLSWKTLGGLQDFIVYAFGSARSSCFDLIDYICSNWVLPLNGLFSALYVGWIWGAGKAVRELYRQGSGVRMNAYEKTEELKTLLLRRVPVRSWAFFILFVSPILVFIAFLFAAGFFS